MPYHRSMLNAKLITKQELTPEEVHKICTLHDTRVALFEKMAIMDPKTCQRQLLICVEKLEQIEFDLQSVWGFEQSSHYHSWWYLAPHCRCPKMDNQDTVGTEWNYYTDDCPLHGEHTWTSKRGWTTRQVLFLISQFDPLYFKELGVNPWKAYSKVLNGKIRKFKNKCADWWV